MFAQRLGIYVCLGLLSLSVAYKITPIVVQDGIPDFVNATTDPFMKIGNGYYFIERDNRKNWFAAYQSCRNMGAGLIDFESIEEWNVISNYLNDTEIYRSDFYWTSGTSLAGTKATDHAWFSTGKPISLDIWSRGQPDNQGGSEFCDEMTTYGVPKLYGLNDFRCSAASPYICKAQQPATASFLVW